MKVLVQFVADVMRRDLVSCERGSSLRTVARLMAEHGSQFVVVTDDDSHASAPWGVVSDLDLVAAASVRELDEQTAGVSATVPAVTIGPRDTVKRAGHLMAAYGVSYLVVVEPLTGQPVGVVTTLDLAELFAAR